jgi:hypothetical protein
MVGRVVAALVVMELGLQVTATRCPVTGAFPTVNWTPCEELISSGLKKHSRGCNTITPATPSQPPAHTCSTPCTTETATVLDRMDAPPAPEASVLMLIPLSRFPGPAFPVVVPRCLACLVLPTRSGMMRFPFPVCLSPPPLCLLPVLLLPHLLMVMMMFLFGVSHALLLGFRVMIML